jgi:PIN domain nuclease of toxin-antitoxin system
MSALEQDGFALLGISAAHLSTLAALPSYYRDPFGRLFIAQAMAEGGALLSDDRRIQRYPVRCIPCSEVSPPPADYAG